MSFFQEKSALITGAASGIGYALCQALWQRGARVYATDINTQGLAKLHESSAGAIQTIALNASDASAMQNLQERIVSEHGALDFQFNNAGIVAGGPFEAMSMDSWHKIVDINLWAVVHGSRLAYAQMKKQGHGHIVNTASTAGMAPVAKSTAYAMTKHAVVGLSTSLREEARPYGVHVSVAIPGLVDTAIFGQAINLAGHDYAAAMKQVPIKKISPQQAAIAMLKGVENNQQFIVFPLYNKLIVALNRLLPGLMARLLNR
ncbi:MAG: SDR family NAD(P)-dependent oxidoreductase [Oceanococcus sp.]